jgi:hypothetical protein
MQEKHLFEYSVIRVVPYVEREEFLNIGVIMFCSSKRFLQIMFELREERLLALTHRLDIEELEQLLLAFKRVCAGTVDAGPIGKLPMASRFRWLTAARSTIVQASPVHPGLCADPKPTLVTLYNKLVQ